MSRSHTTHYNDSTNSKSHRDQLQVQYIKAVEKAAALKNELDSTPHRRKHHSSHRSDNRHVRKPTHVCQPTPTPTPTPMPIQPLQPTPIIRPHPVHFIRSQPIQVIRPHPMHALQPPPRIIQYMPTPYIQPAVGLQQFFDSNHRHVGLF